MPAREGPVGPLARDEQLQALQGAAGRGDHAGNRPELLHVADAARQHAQRRAPSGGD